MRRKRGVEVLQLFGGVIAARVFSVRFFFLFRQQYWHSLTPNFLIMAIGKNKKGRKGGRKKIIEPMTRKDWYDVQVPSIFNVRNIGKTLVNRTAGLSTSPLLIAFVCLVCRVARRQCCSWLRLFEWFGGRGSSGSGDGFRSYLLSRWQWPRC